MDLIAGIDLGTSYFKAAVFDVNGRQLGLGRAAVEKDTANGKCELPAGRFWQLLQKAMGQACQEAKASTGSIRAISYSSQANSFILLDKDDNELTPLILWPDLRAQSVPPEAASLWQRPDFIATTGIGIDCGPGFCVAKLKYFQNVQPEIWRRCRSVMTISDYFTFCLTGKKIGDGSTASLLGLYSPEARGWWPEAFEMLKLEQGIFSQPLLPGSTAGNIKLKNATLPGLPSECVVSVGGLDHYIAAIGAGIGTVADISESTGTVLACINVSNSFLPKPGVCCGPCINEGKFYNLAFSSNGASVLEWYQQNYASQFSIPELIQECQKLTGSEGLAANECANEYPGLTGFKNTRSEHTAAHFARAILESNSNTLAWLLKQLGAEEKSAVVATGGGAKSDFWLQLKANTLGRKIIRTNSQEPACRGAAMLAARSLFQNKPFERLSSEWIGIEREFNFAV